jgi:hypothetical protein
MGLLSFWVAGCKVEMSPEEARKAEAEYQVLDVGQVATLEAYAEVLVPGSAEAGLAHFIDHQLNASPAEQMLMIKYLGVSPPFNSFYTAGLGALNAAAQAAYGKVFSELEDAQKVELSGQVAQGIPEGWEGPPAPFFHFVLRSDAVDVFYGTPQGTENYGIPYMAHIMPTSRWGE